MSQGIDDSRRQVIPRWRPFQVAAALGMVDAVRPETGRHLIELPLGDLHQALSDFERNRSPVFAAGLVDAALVANRPEVAEDAATLLLSESSNSPRQRLANAILGHNKRTPLSEPPELSTFERYRRIAGHRKSLRITPTDPIRWVDLAREYTILGEDAAAGRALRIAVALAPHDRFVLRAASRYYLHRHEPDEAQRLLLRTPRTREDPWLLAAEIVCASRVGTPSRLTKLARKMVEAESFRARHITELASALGTLEHQAGNRRNVRRLFAAALTDPTENTVAQAEWISRHMPAFDVPQEKLTVPRAFEAKAWAAIELRDFVESQRQALEWFRDEPFATRSALFAGSVSALGVGDFRTALDLTSELYERDQEDPRILVQLVFFMAYMNRVEEAERLLDRLPAVVRERNRSDEDDEIGSAWKVYEKANRGLIAFRRGRPSEAREHYLEAIRLARELNNEVAVAGALVFYAREEARLDPAAARETVAAAKNAISSSFPPALRPLYEVVIERDTEWLPDGAIRRS